MIIKILSSKKWITNDSFAEQVYLCVGMGGKVLQLSFPEVFVYMVETAPKSKHF